MPNANDRLMQLNMLEASIVCQIRQLVHLTPAPDPAVSATVCQVEKEAREHGLTFSAPVVMAVLYPDWDWGRVTVLVESEK